MFYEPTLSNIRDNKLTNSCKYDSAEANLLIRLMWWCFRDGGCCFSCHQLHTTTVNHWYLKNKTQASSITQSAWQHAQNHSRWCWHVETSVPRYLMLKEEIKKLKIIHKNDEPLEWLSWRRAALLPPYSWCGECTRVCPRSWRHSQAPAAAFGQVLVCQLSPLSQ